MARRYMRPKNSGRLYPLFTCTLLHRAPFGVCMEALLTAWPATDRCGTRDHSGAHGRRHPRLAGVPACVVPSGEGRHADAFQRDSATQS